MNKKVLELREWLLNCNYIHQPGLGENVYTKKINGYEFRVEFITKNCYIKVSDKNNIIKDDTILPKHHSKHIKYVLNVLEKKVRKIKWIKNFEKKK